ncbi:DUF6615 family protein [Bradyrhizobium sp. AZCC 1721]|uniref:DUF6615 family protein n=1 Tax=Bradyrhizobium sp. AZCC 1721 TaxID=3117016 RepID=UPI002FF132B5
MLCELAHSFSPRIAELLERDRGLTRNFREETVTDLFMASLVGLEAFGVRVDFPDEPTTGGDMDWIYAAPLELNGGRYLRLILQAKRAQFAKLKSGGYWYYHHLDHGSPSGQQAQTLIAYASTTPAGMATLPLYILYHPTSALAPATHNRPAIEGVNLVFAHHVAPVVFGGCARTQKKVDYWRDRFMPLSEILCWPAAVTEQRDPAAAGTTQFMVGLERAVLPGLTGAFHPDVVARRLGEQRARTAVAAAPDAPTPPPIKPVDGIPEDIRRAIEGQVTKKDRKELKRPRVILSTRMRRDSPNFDLAEQLSRRRD